MPATINIDRCVKEALRSNTECCYNCRHYWQHYIRTHIGDWISFDEIFAGHCVFPRIKNRKPYDVCDHFEHRQTPDFPSTIKKGESQ